MKRARNTVLAIRKPRLTFDAGAFESGGVCGDHAPAPTGDPTVAPFLMLWGSVLIGFFAEEIQNLCNYKIYVTLRVQCLKSGHA